MYYKTDFEEFLNNNSTPYGFAIIDPPWNYDDKSPSLTDNQLTYDLWDNIKLIDIFNKLDVSYMFIWVTSSMLPVVFDCWNSSGNNYEYKTVIPWIKTTSKDNICYGLGNSFRQCCEYLVLFQKPGSDVLRLPDRALIVEETGSRTIKPKVWERQLVDKLNKKGLNGVYIFSGGNLDFIDCVDVIEEKTHVKPNLFE